MKSIPWVISICAISLAGHVYIAKENRIDVLNTEIDLSEKARGISDDQVRDLLFALGEANRESEAKQTQAFIAGVVDSIRRPDQTHQIWHDGYDRGTEVQAVANQVATKDVQQLVNTDSN